MKITLSYIAQLKGKREELQPYFKFIRYNFALSSTMISELETVNFYLELMKHLHKKRLTIEGVELYYSNPSFDQHSESISGDTEGNSNCRKTNISERENQPQKDSLTAVYDDIVDK
jgi:hypothetical protein